MNTYQKLIKRSFDLIFGVIGLLALWWLILILVIGARIDTGMSGIFKQKRVGKGGKLFNVYKVRSMRNIKNFNSNITTNNDPRISRYGWFLRKTKLDELPQLFNIVLGDMSFVGPRPDVQGFADKLKGDDRIILTIRPGITGPATIFFRNEEELLARVVDPESYNRDIIWPKKAEINKQYVKNYSLGMDLMYIFQTIFGNSNSRN